MTLPSGRLPNRDLTIDMIRTTYGVDLSAANLDVVQHQWMVAEIKAANAAVQIGQRLMMVNTYFADACRKVAAQLTETAGIADDGLEGAASAGSPFTQHFDLNGLSRLQAVAAQAGALVEALQIALEQFATHASDNAAAPGEG